MTTQNKKDKKELGFDVRQVLDASFYTPQIATTLAYLKDRLGANPLSTMDQLWSVSPPVGPANEDGKMPRP